MTEPAMTGPGSADTPLALFDLDDTLSNRSAGFHDWVLGWIGRHQIGDPGALAWMIIADNGGYNDRVEMFRLAADHFGLSASPEEMAEDYRATSHDAYHRDPVVIAALQSLVDRGWRVGVVTNGGPGQDQKVDRIGIRPLLSCCVVSETVGVRKPDPEIFALAIAAAGGADRSRTWMVGDHPGNDIVGAHHSGLSTVWIAHGRSWPAGLRPPDMTVASLNDAFAHLRAAISS